jgi:CRP/FNR family cyclic AMP-dependent transcriptional regulator
MKAAEPKRLLRGEVLFREGEPGESCYWVMQGALKISVSSSTGDERVFALLGPGSVVGELAILDNRPRSATATAFSDTNLTVLKRAVLRMYLRRNPSVWADLVAILVGRLREADKALSADSFLPLPARVARVILSLCDQVGEAGQGPDIFVLPNTVSQHDIGAMAGVARESVSRVLSKWKRRGIVVRDPGNKLSLNKSMLEFEAAASQLS